jgi:predicted transcriptional regulator
MGKTKLTVSIDETIKKDLKILALKQDTTASKIIESCIKKYLEEYSDLL